MEEKGIKVVERFYFQDGDHLYPESGYTHISNPLRYLTPSVFGVTLAGNIGLVTEDNGEVLPLEYSFISELTAIIGDRFYFEVAKRSDENVFQEGIVRLDKENGKWIPTVVISCEWEEMAGLYTVGSDGWFLVKSKRSSNKIGLVNIITGAKIEPAYQAIEKFEHGLAPVGTITKVVNLREIGIIGDYREHLWGMIDEQGKLVVPMKYPDEEFKEIKPELITRYGKK